MAKADKWKKQKQEKDVEKINKGHASGARGVKGDGGRKPAPSHSHLTSPAALPKALTVDSIRVDGDLDLSIFDDLEPDQDFMIQPSQPTVDHVYTVAYNPVSGKQEVAATDPATIVTAPPDYSEVTSDGGTPSTPTVTLVSGPGWIKVKWPASTGTSDPLHYKVFMRATSDPTTGDDTYLVADTQDLESVVNKLTGGTQLSDATTYKVIVKAYSRVSGGGTSADSSVASGSPAAIDASVTTISNLNAGNITTGTLSASFISSGTLSASVVLSGSIKTATSGERLEIDNTNGLRIFDGGATDYGAGAGVTTKLPISGDPFVRGTIKALTLTLRTDSAYSANNSVRWQDPTTSATLGYIMTSDNGSGFAPSMAMVVQPDDDTGSGNIDIIAASETDYTNESAGVAQLSLSSPADITPAASYVKARTRDNADPSIDESILIYNSRQQSDLQHIGTIQLWGTPISIPYGWKECNGQILNQADWPELFEAICPRILLTSITNASPAVITLAKRDSAWGGQGPSYASGD